MPFHERFALRRLLLLLSLVSTYIRSAVGNEVKISNVDEFKNFVSKVNSGTNYSGTTVYLGSDLSLPDITEPFGKDIFGYFNGTFDGQGHIISDLKINYSSLGYTGLFGYSRGMTIRNIVLDSSCSITSSYNGSNSVYIGGFIGDCYGIYGECNIKNSVNMADVTFKGNTSGSYLCLGGVAGRLYSSHGILVANYINYGSLAHLGIAYNAYIGGIAGRFESSGYAQNNINHGAITHSGTTSMRLYLGGISGESSTTYIENCVCAGKISTLTVALNTSYIGSVVGRGSSRTRINNSFCVSDIGKYPINGTGTSAIDDETSHVEVNISLVNKLNSYAAKKNKTWSKWLLNMDNKQVTFTINNRKGLTINSQIDLFPDPAVDDAACAFSGWYTDAMLTLPFTDDEVKSDTTLYGVLCRSSNYTVALDVNCGDALSLPSVHPMIIECNGRYGTLPSNLERVGHTFTGWFTESEGGEDVEAGDIVTSTNNHTLYAHWSANNYTITFDINGGNMLSIPSKKVVFNSTYGTLPEVNRTGYIFKGWFTSKNESVTSDTRVTNANNHTLYAHWEEITSNVEIVFGSKDLTKEEVEKIVKKYVGAETTFEIIEIRTDSKTGETTVIVKFAETKKAEDFVRVANVQGRGENNLIKHVGFVLDGIDSSSSLFHPFLLFYVVPLLL